MQVRETGKGYVIKLSRGEKVVETLTNFCAERGIESGIFHALGAVKNTTIGYYDFNKREYFFKTFPEDMEVASMTGDVALLEGKPFLHIHAVLSRMDEGLSTVGAHIKEAEVAVTLEVFLEDWGVKVERRYDEETGLNLFSL